MCLLEARFVDQARLSGPQSDLQLGIWVATQAAGTYTLHEADDAREKAWFIH